MRGVTHTNTILDKIITRKVEEVAALHVGQHMHADSPPRDFAGALRRADGCVALIAEIKHASPSKGLLIDPFDPAGLAAAYAAGGASAISVLTDRDFFQGSLDDLKAARAAAAVPILRKDFTIDVKQIVEARGAGADAILLIATVLEDARLRDLRDAAWDYEMAALIEVHNEAELERALKLGARLIGINNRDLHTFNVDLGVTQRLAGIVTGSPEITLVAESGIFTVADVETVAAAGAHAILVGESLVRAPDITGQVRALSGVKRMQ
jgi:indole-3-glycerol phosphate synthase